MTRPIDEGLFIPESMTVHVGGGFNGWSCSAELEEFDESVYELEVRIPSHPVGVSEYKFNISCEEFSWEPELSNRTYVVTSDLPDEDGDGFLELTPAVAFYNALENPFIDAELVFEVDMSVYEREGLFDPANDTVVVRGEFNGWDCTEGMTPAGDGIHRVSVELPGMTVGSIVVDSLPKTSKPTLLSLSLTSAIPPASNGGPRKILKLVTGLPPELMPAPGYAAAS